MKTNGKAVVIRHIDGMYEVRWESEGWKTQLLARCYDHKEAGEIAYRYNHDIDEPEPVFS